MLNIRSCYSISQSVIKIDALATVCAEFGLSYVSICDDSFFGLPLLLKAAKKNDLKPVFGYRYTTDTGIFTFFIKTKKSYFKLIQFTNECISLDQLLDEEEIIVVFSGEKASYLELIEKYPALYYGINTENEVDEIERTVFFKPINALKEDDFEALDLIRKIGKIDSQNTAVLQSLESALQLFQEDNSKTAFINMNKIVEEIQEFDLSVDYTIPLLNPTNDENKLLYDRCYQQLREKGFDSNEAYRQRFDDEFSVISQMGFSRYLLLAADIVDTAKELRAWIGPGRGSAVSSLLIYLLGITQADPIENGLIFERFLSLDRDDEPDIDIDVEDEMRQELLSALRKKYSKERMVNVITFGTYGVKLVKRELSKHFNIDQQKLNGVKYQKLISKIIGLPHHVSTHAAGLIFSEEDLRKMIPLRDLSEDAFMTQYDMNSLKACGLFKMDILGLITLSTLKKMGIPFESLDIQDKAVFKHINTDNLCGIFQLDSKTGRKLTETFTPENFDEVRILISINRPGPAQSGLTEELINRRNGTKTVEYYHPLVKEILSKTWGVPVYQEQIMEMSMKLAGFSPKQANELRKAMAKKDHTIMSKLKAFFVDGACKNDMERDAAEELFEMMAEFAGYAFNKAHATAYGLITYWMAYTKHHKPLQFYKTLIDSSHGKYSKLHRILNEARKNGIKILSPDINLSDYETKIQQESLRLGFNLVKDLNNQTIKKIIEERQKDQYTTVEDFILRMDKAVLSDFILKRLLEAHLFEHLSDKMQLDDMIRIRDKNAKTLEKIGAKLFGEVTNKEGEQTIQNHVEEIKNDAPAFLQEEIQSYGLLINIEKVFGLAFDPFINSDFNIGMITKELKANRYELNNGIDYAIINPFKKLKEGETVIVLNHRNEAHFKGTYDPKLESIDMDQKYLFEFEQTFSKNKMKMKKAGIKQIKIQANKYNLEVLL